MAECIELGSPMHDVKDLAPPTTNEEDDKVKKMFVKQLERGSKSSARNIFSMNLESSGSFSVAGHSHLEHDDCGRFADGEFSEGEEDDEDSSDASDAEAKTPGSKESEVFFRRSSSSSFLQPRRSKIRTSAQVSSTHSTPSANGNSESRRKRGAYSVDGPLASITKDNLFSLSGTSKNDSPSSASVKETSFTQTTPLQRDGKSLPTDNETPKLNESPLERNEVMVGALSDREQTAPLALTNLSPSAQIGNNMKNLILRSPSSQRGRVPSPLMKSVSEMNYTKDDSSHSSATRRNVVDTFAERRLRSNSFSAFQKASPSSTTPSGMPPMVPSPSPVPPRSTRRVGVPSTPSRAIKPSPRPSPRHAQIKILSKHDMTLSLPLSDFSDPVSLDQSPLIKSLNRVTSHSESRNAYEKEEPSAVMAKTTTPKSTPSKRIKAKYTALPSISPNPRRHQAPNISPSVRSFPKLTPKPEQGGFQVSCDPSSKRASCPDTVEHKGAKELCSSDQSRNSLHTVTDAPMSTILTMAKGSARSEQTTQYSKNQQIKAKSIFSRPSGWDCNSPLDDLINAAGEFADTDGSLSDSDDEGIGKSFFLDSPAVLMAQKIEALESASTAAAEDVRTSSSDNDFTLSPKNRRARQRRKCNKEELPFSTSVPSHNEESRQTRGRVSSSKSVEDRCSSRCSECDEEIMAANRRSEDNGIQSNNNQVDLSLHRANSSIPAGRSSAMSFSSSSTLDSFFANLQRKDSAVRPWVSIPDAPMDDQCEQRNLSRMSNGSAESSVSLGTGIVDVGDQEKSVMPVSSPTALPVVPKRWPQRRRTSQKEDDLCQSDAGTEQKDMSTLQLAILPIANAASGNLPIEDPFLTELISPAMCMLGSPKGSIAATLNG